MDKQTATLSLPNGKKIEFKIKSGSVGPDVIDVSNLYKDAGMFTFDPGFISTASTESSITFINGEKGELLHRGYPISELAENFDFLEIAHLLLYKELPKPDQFKNFLGKVNQHTMLHEQMYKMLSNMLRSAHPMSTIIALLSSLSSFYCHENNAGDNYIELTCLRGIAKISTIVAAVYKYSIGQPFVFPQNIHDYTSNFLHMMFSVPCEEYKINKTFRDALNIIFILHADHEQNASTSTVRLSGSTGANPFACLAAGVASLWGPAHGGANEAVIKMLNQIGKVENIKSFIEKVKSKEDDTKLMGFGHRVYKNFDPRASVLKEKCQQVLKVRGSSEEDSLFEIAQQLEQIALQDDYFIGRKLYPNVDFYSGIILKAIGIPTVMFTPIFALARTSGWIAHWKEMMETPLKIGRPRQLYVGEKQRRIETS